MLPALAHGARVLFLDELATHSDVVEAVEHVRIGGRAVAPGAADLLVVGLDAARQVGMEDVATSALSIPMPKAMVATMTTPGSESRATCPIPSASP